MKVRPSSQRPILEPCSLKGFAYQLDPYIGCEHLCSYCYALNRAKTDWTNEILIHQDLANQLERELSALEPQRIYMGWNTDPYQPLERKHQQTRQALELLSQRGFSVSILTKSDLVVRDIDLLLRMPEPSVGFSIAFQDEQVRQRFEATSPPNERRIAALRRLKGASIRTYTLICPVMPFITDVAALIELVAPHVDTIWIYALRMEAEGDSNWQNVKGILDRHFPGLTEQYRQIAFSAAHPYWAQLRRELEKIQRRSRLDLRIELRW
jgi:DNA repair photolyase